jgi:hypothetical protein
MKSKEKLVLGIAGYARTGKDMVGSTLVKMCKKNSVRIVKLASSLREIVKADPKTPKWMNVYSEEPKMKSEVRPLLVKTAQEKRKKDPYFFTNKVIEDIKKHEEETLHVITDVRYEDEVCLLSETFPNFEFIALHRKDMQPSTEEEEKYTSPLYDAIDQYTNGTSLFIPELSQYLEADQKFMSNHIVTAALVAEVLTLGLPDFSKNKLFITENLTEVGYDAMQTVSELGINLNYLEKHYL